MATQSPPRKSSRFGSTIHPVNHQKLKREEEAGNLSAGYQSAILKALLYQIQEHSDRTMFELFGPMVKVESGGTVVSFAPYDYQSDLIRRIEENTKILITKSRQMGVSETVCCYLLMRAITEPGFKAIVFSKTLDDSVALGRRIRNMAESLGALCPEPISKSDKKLSFKKLGSILFLPGTSKSARGIPSVSVIFFDEAAFINEIDGIYQAASATTSMVKDAKIIFNSTPNGQAGLFYRLMVSGVDEKKRAFAACKSIAQAQNTIEAFRRKEHHTQSWVFSGWCKIFLHWRAHPVYGEDPDWAERKRESLQLTQAQWDQEFELSFKEGSSVVFPPELVEAAAIGQWQKPVAGGVYLIGIDPGFGGADHFVVQVWRKQGRTHSLVAEYRKAYASKSINIHEAKQLIKCYKPTSVNIETNSGGALISEDLHEACPGMSFNEVVTSNRSKIVNTDRLILMMERYELEFPMDSPIAQEMSHFVETITPTGLRSRSAETGQHDDSIMAAAIAMAITGDLPTQSSSPQKGILG